MGNVTTEDGTTIAREARHTHHGHDGQHPGTNAANRSTATTAGDPAAALSEGHHDHHGQGSAQHDAHAGHSAAQFRTLFWISLVLTIPVLVFNETVQGWLSYSAPEFAGSDRIPPALGTIVFLVGGTPFLRGASGEIRARQPGMMLLISMAITTALVASWATTFGRFDLDFWWELAALVTVMLLGHWLEMRAIGRSQGALSALAELLPAVAERVVDDGFETVQLTALRVGDVALVRPGGRVPADGTLLDGEAEVDESMVTGESRPVSKTVGDSLIAGTVVTDSSVKISVTAVGEDLALAGIRRLVARAQESRSRAQALADRAAALLFYVALSAAAATAIAWVAAGQANEAVVRTVAVLVIACPHALGLAIPLVISISTGFAAQHGILVTDRVALERMRIVDVVVFDKTGTLTKGSHVVRDVVSPVLDNDRLLALAAAVEAESEHPLARAITAAAAARGPVPSASGFRSMTGRGVEATVDGTRVAVGGPALLREYELSVPPGIDTVVNGWSGRGASVLYVIESGEVVGAVSLEDEIRPESREAIDELHDLGLRVAVVSGDAEPVVRAVAEALGIDEIEAEVLPGDKHRIVLELQRQGMRVAMVGDGVNDAPALAAADVGIAIGAGTDVAIESAGIVLVSDDPRGVVAIRRLSRSSYRKMIQNLMWATGYNAAALPLAAGALAWAGVVLSPAVAALLMSASTVVVALNAQLLRRLDLRS